MDRNDYTGAVISHSADCPEAASIDWYSFLSRDRLPSPTEESLEQLRKASILVTGAGGSIGRRLSLRLAAMQPQKLVLLDASEQALFHLQLELKSMDIAIMPELRLGSTLNFALLDEVFAMYQPSLVFHAAAHKHVALLEEQPFAAIENNALGTHTLLDAASRHGDDARVILLSTDKAVEPTSILGATKQIAEQLTLNHNGVAVRLANVLGTDGSVVETFLSEIRSGHTITIRGSEPERYFLTEEEAVDLLLIAAAESDTRFVLVPHIERAHRIADLATFLIAWCGRSEQPRIVYGELYPGEKLRETLLASDELATMQSAGILKVFHEPSAMMHTTLESQIAQLSHALEERDLSAALKTILQLVPSYTPSSTVQRLAVERSSTVLQR